jgi:hypothetical protein
VDDPAVESDRDGIGAFGRIELLEDVKDVHLDGGFL